jgi:hypothetical protein
MQRLGVGPRVCDIDTPFLADRVMRGVRFQVGKWFLSVLGNGKELEAHLIVLDVALSQQSSLEHYTKICFAPHRDHRSDVTLKKKEIPLWYQFSHRRGAGRGERR